MVEKYYLDTCIWRDHYESRYGPRGRPLGDYASKLFMKIMTDKSIILFSDLMIKELKIAFDNKDVEEMLNILLMIGILRHIDISAEERSEAKELANNRNVSFGDALHAILARNNDAILVTQNEKDFEKLTDISEYFKPEHLL